MRWDVVTEESMTLLSRSLETVRGCIARGSGPATPIVLPASTDRDRHPRSAVPAVESKEPRPGWDAAPERAPEAMAVRYLMSWIPIAAALVTVMSPTVPALMYRTK